MLKEFYKKYERWWPIASFLGGFLFDVATLDRIDSLISIVKQGLYLGIIGLLLGLEILAHHGRLQPRGLFAKAWTYQEFVIHFLFGTLLSEYTLFFFKSSSLFSSAAFIGGMAVLLVVNEFKRFQGRSGIPVRSALFGLCVASYLVYIVPLVIGFVGLLPFLVSLALAWLIGFFLFKRLRPRLPGQERWLIQHLLLPIGGVMVTLALLYVFHLIPPVPLSVQAIGIFHEVAKKDGTFLLSYNPVGHRFWQMGEYVFYARPGDKPYCFARIFSPSRFKDEVFVHWLMKEGKRGWQSQDRIPLPISGGRADGFRGYTVKSNFQPGDWQVRVETSDGRELGRVYFAIQNDPFTKERPLATETQ